MESGNDDGAFSMIENSLRSAAWVGYVPWVYWTNLRLSPIIGSHLAVTARQGRLLAFAAKAIAERKERGSEHQDILSQFFSVQQEKPEFNDMSITSMVASNIFAGSDSTGASISSLLFYVCKNPESKKKLVDEIDAVAKAQNIQRGEVFSLETANGMPYLQACMWEALRCFPAVGMNLGRVVPPSGVEIDGQYIPGGVSIMLYFGNIVLLTINRPLSGRTRGWFTRIRRLSVKMPINFDQKDGWKIPSVLVI
jgi:cytochrome P450